MRVQNKAMPGAELRLRYSGLTVTGDAEGCFEVPDEDGEFLASLPSGAWERLDGKPAKAPKAPPAPAPAPAAPAAAAPQAAAEAGPEDITVKVKTDPPPAAEEEEATEGPDLDSLDKAGLLEVAAQYEIKASKRWSETRLREELDKALYGEEE
jgi:hypothetical protein